MFTIKKAVRTATPALIGLWSMSGGGKTLSALKMARGLVGEKGKIGLIDTENNRAMFYAKECGGWDHLDFQPPFTPTRYIEAYETFQKKGGYDCIIVDSMSHVWEGEGGVIDMAEANNFGGLKKWQAPKMAYKRMMNNLLRSPTHMIFCLRAKEGSIQTGSGRDMKIIKTGLEPICEKNFIYEMTVSVLIGPDHKPLFEDIGRFSCNEIIPRIKAPQDIADVIAPGEFISEATGEKIREWISGGAEFDKKQAELEHVARDVATLGTAGLKKHWESLGKNGRLALSHIKAEITKTAGDADKENAAPEQPEESDEPSPADTSSLNDEAAVKAPQFTIHLPGNKTRTAQSISEWKNDIRSIIDSIKIDAEMTAFINAHKATFTNIEAAYPDAIASISQQISTALASFNKEPAS